MGDEDKKDIVHLQILEQDGTFNVSFSQRLLRGVAGLFGYNHDKKPVAIEQKSDDNSGQPGV